MTSNDYDILLDENNRVWLANVTVNDQTVFYRFGHFNKNIKQQETILHYKSTDGKVNLLSFKVKLPARLVMNSNKEIITNSHVELLEVINNEQA